MTAGVRQIVRFNWHFYALALVVYAVVGLTIAYVPLHGVVRLGVLAAIAMTAFWIAGSLIASWIVYDRSPLMRGDWIRQALGFEPDAWINLHAGLDESTPALRALFARARGRVFDIFDPADMTEPSIARARRFAPPVEPPERADYRRLPVPTGTIDVAFLLLSAHELRSEEARRALFTELRRVLGPGGRVVIAEHLRDWANFLAFGPGFLHFHSWRTWMRCFERAHFAVRSEFPITPFVRVFVLRRLT
jgi:SAM-dependent methyltransferase